MLRVMQLSWSPKLCWYLKYMTDSSRTLSMEEISRETYYNKVLIYLKLYCLTDNWKKRFFFFLFILFIDLFGPLCGIWALTHNTGSHLWPLHWERATLRLRGKESAYNAGDLGCIPVSGAQSLND